MLWLRLFICYLNSLNHATIYLYSAPIFFSFFCTEIYFVPGLFRTRGNAAHGTWRLIRSIIRLNILKHYFRRPCGKSQLLRHVLTIKMYNILQRMSRKGFGWYGISCLCKRDIYIVYMVLQTTDLISSKPFSWHPL